MLPLVPAPAHPEGKNRRNTPVARFCDVLRKVRLGWKHSLGFSVGQIKAARRSLLWDRVKPACFLAEAFAFEQRAAATGYLSSPHLT